MQDKQFLAEAEKMRIEIEPRTAEQVQEYLNEAWKTPEELVRKVYVALGRDKGEKKKK